MESSTGITAIDNSSMGVQLRREEFAPMYLSGIPTQLLWQQYHTKYGLSRASFEKDITFIRSQIDYNTREHFEDIIDQQLRFLNQMQANAIKEGNNGLALRVQKQVTDLIKLVAPKQANTVNNVQVNNTSTNLSLPELTVDQIKDLLRGGDTIEIG